MGTGRTLTRPGDEDEATGTTDRTLTGTAATKPAGIAADTDASPRAYRTWARTSRRRLVDAGVLLAVLVAAWFVGDIVVRRVQLDGWPAYDTRAYWLAGRHLLDGAALYAPAEVWTFGAFKYPPLFAQLCVPLALVPAPAVDWAWRLGALLAFRYLAGSWRVAIVATALHWAFLLELDLGNVTFLLGAACLWALRDRRGAYLLPWFAALKFGPALLMVYLWFRRPEYRRPLVVGTAVFAAACAVSFAAAPGLWWDYAGTFGWETSSRLGEAAWLLAIFPDHGGFDLVARFALAAAATIVAIRLRQDWLAFVAAVVTCPVLTLYRLAPLIALWQLWRPTAEAALRRAARLLDPRDDRNALASPG